MATEPLEEIAATLARCAAGLRRLGGAGGAADDLVVVGTGIRIVGHLSLEALQCIVEADRLPYVVADPTADRLLRLLNPAAAESLGDLYEAAKPRRRTYEEMVDRILRSVRAGARTCAVFYGHPGVFVRPAHAAIERARQEGFSARMLPAVSAEDCLFADLGVDPASAGCQAYEATDFLINGRRLDPTGHVVLWQIGVVGRWDQHAGEPSPAERSVLRLVLDRLGESYPGDQRVAVYEASRRPGAAPRIEWTTLAELESARLSMVSTLYIPPGRPPRTDFYLLQTLGAR